MFCRSNANHTGIQVGHSISEIMLQTSEQDVAGKHIMGYCHSAVAQKHLTPSR
jgi:hypothetical protein